MPLSIHPSKKLSGNPIIQPTSKPNSQPTAQLGDCAHTQKNSSKIGQIIDKLMSWYCCSYCCYCCCCCYCNFPKTQLNCNKPVDIFALFLVFCVFFWKIKKNTKTLLYNTYIISIILLLPVFAVIFVLRKFQCSMAY